MKKKLFSLFVAFAMAAAASAQVTYTCTAGKKFGDNEGCEKIFDGNIDTKWTENAGEDCFVLFNTSEPVYVWGYEFTTANDNELYGRLQKQWKLYGSTTDLAQNADGWVELSSVDSKDWIVRKNFYTQRFYCKDGAEDNAYKYFKLVILDGGFMQFSEFKLCCDTNPVVAFKWAGGEEGAKKTLDRDLGQKWEANNLEGKNFIIEAKDGEAHALMSYAFTTHDDGNGGCENRAPKDWTIEGSNDKNAWFTVARVTDGQIANQNYSTFSYKSSVTDLAFRYYRITVNSFKGNYKQIGEFFAVGGDAFAANVGYKWVSGDNDDLKKLLDMDSHSKAEGDQMPDGVKFTVETNDGQAHTVRAYTMSTHDDGSWKDRAPKSWILEGSNDQTNWITIDDVNNDPIENVNYDVKRFVPANQDAAVRYLRLTVRNFKGGYHQLAEFNAVSGCTGHDWVLTSGKEPTCTEDGAAVYTCSICGDVKEIADMPLLGHDYADGFCTRCHDVDPAYMTAVAGFYQPTTVVQFNWLAAMIQAGNEVNIQLTQDVDLTGFAGFGNGDDVKPFKGEFDGQGHWLKNLRIDVSKKNTGLFGMVEGANIHDLGITGANVKSNQQNCAILVGNANNTTISRVAIKMSKLQGNDHVGSVAGNTEGTTTISNCLSDCEVVSTDWQAGGMVGTSNGLTLEKNLFVGSVSNGGGGGNAAGLISLLENGTHTISNNISAASLIYAQNRDVKPIAVPNEKTATYTNNRVAASSLFKSGNNEPAIQNYNAVDENEGLTTADRDMQCRSFLAGTMSWDMTNDWKMIAAGQWPVLAWMEAETAQTVTVTAAGYATFVAKAELTLPESAPVYAAQLKGEYVHLEPITGSIPAGEAVIVKGEGEYTFSYAVEYAEEVENNELVAAVTEIDADGTQYILAEAGGKVGFYPVMSGSKIPAGKGYLVSRASAKAFYFEEEIATGISPLTLSHHQGEEEIYNLSGQRISKMQKGVNIVKGRKISIK